MLLRCNCRSIAIATAALTTSAAVQAQTVLTASSWLPLTHVLPETQRSWCAPPARKTASKANCNILPHAVTAPPGTFDTVRTSLGSLLHTMQGHTQGRFVTNQMDDVPYLGNSSGSVSAAFQRPCDKYLATAETKGLKDARKVLAELRAGIKTLAANALFGVMWLTRGAAAGRRLISASVPGSLELPAMMMALVIHAGTTGLAARRAGGVRFARAVARTLGAACKAWLSTWSALRRWPARPG